MKSNRLFLLPLLLLMASCSRYTEAEIKGVCSRYFAAERNAYNLLQKSNRNYAEYQKWIKELTLAVLLERTSDYLYDSAKKEKTFIPYWVKKVRDD